MTPIDFPISSRIARRVALIGNPNCGKTTLFNILTGANQRVGNWAGVTVERKSGYLTGRGKGDIEIIDLPGTYSLTLVGELAEDERITRDYLRQGQYDLVLNVVDATSLERNLYLTIQLLELGVPVVVVLNRTDLLKNAQLQKIATQLSEKLGCPVISTAATTGEGIKTLKERLYSDLPKPNANPIHYHLTVEREVTALSAALKQENHLIKPSSARHQVLSTLEGEQSSYDKLVLSARKRIYDETGNEADVLIATQRYQFLEKTCAQLVVGKNLQRWTSRFDKLVLSRFLGLPIFFMVMYTMFLFAINIGGLFQDSVDVASNAIFVDGLAVWLKNMHIPDALISILAYGVGKGINTTVTFIPVIGAMFLALTFLEDCGFMARAAFVMDRLMRALGLPGKAFVPMIVGFGCNVPAILGARHLENKRDRILTIMMSPFMSCGARLAIFTVFVATFFPAGGQNWVFALYLIGILMAIFTGMLLKRTLLKGPSAPLILEMPAYQLPRFAILMRHTWHRLSKFIFNAGKLIVLVCAIMGALNAMRLDNNQNESVLEELSKQATPIFQPMGIDEENWPAAVALFSGLLAKEVVIGTLNTLYQQAVGEEQEDISLSDWSLKTELLDALATIPENAHKIGAALINPISASAPDESLTYTAGDLMRAQFHGKAGAFAYLLFVLLYFPCVSAVSAIAKEINKKWALFSVVWTTGLAYCIAVVFYQAATFSLHPLQSQIWFGIAFAFIAVIYIGLRCIAKRENRRRILPTPIMLSTSSVTY